MSASPRRLNAAGLAAIMLGGVLPGISTGTIGVMLPGISDAFDGASHSLLIKMVSTAGGLGMMFGAPVGGVLADRLGRRRTFLSACLIFAAAGLAIMVAGALWQLILARFIVGFTAGAAATCVFALVSDHFTGAAQGRWLGYNGALSTFLIVLLVPLAGALTDTGWRNGFLIYAFSLPVCLLVLLGVPGRDPPDAGAAAAAPAHGMARLPLTTLLLAIVAGTIATGTSLYWPFKLRELGVLSASGLAFYAVPNILVVTLGALSYGFIRRWLSMTQVFAVTGLLSAAGLICVALADSPVQVLIGLMIEGVAVGVITPNLSMYAISIAPPHARGRTIGLMKGAIYGSPFLTQFPLEAINKAGGPSAALTAIAALGGAMGITMIAAALRQRAATRGEREA